MQVYICKCPCTFCWRTKNKLFAKASLRSNVTILSMIWQIINNRFRWRCSALWLDIIGVVFVIVYSGFSQVQNDKEVFCLPLHYFINRQRQNTFYDLAKWKNKRRATEINCLIEKKNGFSCMILRRSQSDSRKNGLYLRTALHAIWCQSHVFVHMHFSQLQK